MQLERRPGYDSKGNITAIGSSAYGYSSENLLTSAPGYTLTYDPLNRFYELVGTNPRRRVYDGDELIMEYHPNGAMSRRFVHGPGTDEPLVWYGGGGSVRRFLHADERGSIVSATDSAGTPVVTYRYDEYGLGASGNSGTFFYTGQTGYTELGLYYYKNRWRHPKLDRFMQTDPIGYGAGMNMYAYVKGDPVNFVDPMGLEPKEGENEDEDSGDNDITIWGRVSGAAGAAAGSLMSAARSHARQWDDPTVNALLDTADAVEHTADIVITGVRKARAIMKPSLWTRIKQGARWAGRQLFGCGCFEAGTLVSTPDGLRRIEDIKVGDMVLSVNDETGEIAAKAVTDLIRPEPKPLYALSLLDASEEVESFNATDDHPWKVNGKGWVETIDLKPGDRVETGSGAGLVVTTLSLTDRVEKTYTLTVADWHTFMVGEDGAIVHNACIHSPERQALEEMAKDFQRRRYMSRSDFEAFQDLNRSLKDPIPFDKVRIDLGHPTRGPHSQKPHVHLGNKGHIELVEDF